MTDTFAEFEAKVSRHGMTALEYQRNLGPLPSPGPSGPGAPGGWQPRPGLESLPAPQGPAPNNIMLPSKLP